MMPYRDAALQYMTHGWAPLPVGNQPGEKTPPPTGYTGADGQYPNEDQIVAWIDSHGDRNIGIRMPADIIGIDVDGYDNKPGVFTMKAAAERHGRLPATWVSTSRTDMSGIRWFRLPQPQTLPGKLIHPDNEEQSGVEVIQRHHRFAVVPPSIHPSGRPYRWITPDGQPTSDIPTKDSIPHLPQQWIDHIRKECSCWATFDWDRYKQGDRKNPVADAYDKWSRRMTSTYGRHDAALGGAMALAAFAAKDWPGAEQALQQLERDFYTSLGDSRNQKEAHAEWRRLEDGARQKAHTTTIPQWEDRTTPPTPETPEEVDQAVMEELMRLRVRDRARQLFRREQNPRSDTVEKLNLEHLQEKAYPPIRWRIDQWQPTNSRVLLAAQYKAGKTTLTGNLARCLADGDMWLGTAAVEQVKKVTIIDLEMSERQIVEWLKDQGIKNPSRIDLIAIRGKASSFDILDDKIRSEWAERIKGTDYLIFDCVRPALDAIGLDEHTESGRFLTAFDELCDEAGVDDALVVHHMGHQGERSRGDSRFRDWPDVEWRLVRENADPASDRYLTAFGRDVSIPESGLRYDPETRHIRLEGGSRADSELAELIPTITDWINHYMRTIGKKPAKTEVSRGVAAHDDMPGKGKVGDAIDYGIKTGQITLELSRSNNAKLLSVPVSSFPTASQEETQ